MNKNDLVSAVTSTSAARKGDAARAVGAVCNVIIDALSRAPLRRYKSVSSHERI